MSSFNLSVASERAFLQTMVAAPYDFRGLDKKMQLLEKSALLSAIKEPSYSVKPKSIDFTGFDDFILPQTTAESDGYRSIMYRITDKSV